MTDPMTKMGRPTIYNDSMPILLFEAMSEGKSITRFCRDVRIARKTFYEWIEKHQDFSDAFDLAEVRCEAFWEDWLVNNFTTKDVNSTLVKLFFANRFGWREQKKEVISDDAKSLVERIIDKL